MNVSKPVGGIDSWDPASAIVSDESDGMPDFTIGIRAEYGENWSTRKFGAAAIMCSNTLAKA